MFEKLVATYSHKTRRLTKFPKSFFYDKENSQVKKTIYVGIWIGRYVKSIQPQWDVLGISVVKVIFMRGK